MLLTNIVENVIKYSKISIYVIFGIACKCISPLNIIMLSCKTGEIVLN